MNIIDGLNKRFGKDTVFIAGIGINKKRSMKREKKKPKLHKSAQLRGMILRLQKLRNN